MGKSIRNENQSFWIDARIDGAHATGEHSLGVTIPANAIILRVIEDTTALVGTTDDSGTIQLLLGSSGTAITATNAMPTAGVTETVLSATGLGAKLTSAKVLTANIATRAMTSGAVEYHVEYKL